MVINWICFLTISVPVIVKCVIESRQLFNALDLFYATLWDKLCFCVKVMAFLYRQWLNGNVKKLGDARYELTFSLDGELCKMNVKKNNPLIVDVQNVETDESYITELEPYVKFTQEKWSVPAHAMVYYDDGTAKKFELIDQ